MRRLRARIGGAVAVPRFEWVQNAPQQGFQAGEASLQTCYECFAPEVWILLIGLREHALPHIVYSPGPKPPHAEAHRACLMFPWWFRVWPHLQET